MEEVDVPIWFNYDLSNEKQYVKCIKHLQRIVRGSMSYDVWQKRSKIGIQECPICGLSRDLIKLESHHYPATLYDVIDEKLQMEIDLDTLKDKTDFEIAQEIMDDHTQKKVNYVVLCEYCHKKYHDNVPEVLEVIDEIWKKQKEDRENFFKKDNNGIKSK